MPVLKFDNRFHVKDINFEKGKKRGGGNKIGKELKGGNKERKGKGGAKRGKWGKQDKDRDGGWGNKTSNKGGAQETGSSILVFLEAQFTNPISNQ